MSLRPPLVLKFCHAFKKSHFTKWTLTRPRLWAKGNFVLDVLPFILQIISPSLSTLLCPGNLHQAGHLHFWHQAGHLHFWLMRGTAWNSRWKDKKFPTLLVCQLQRLGPYTEGRSHWLRVLPYSYWSQGVQVAIPWPSPFQAKEQQCFPTGLDISSYLFVFS